MISGWARDRTTACLWPLMHAVQTLGSADAEDDPEAEVTIAKSILGAPAFVGKRPLAPEASAQDNEVVVPCRVRCNHRCLAP